MAKQPKKSNAYDNESITALKGAERVRKRPGVIFGSDGLQGCEHAIFEILSNSIDEARGGFGDKIIMKKHKDGSISVEDFGRGLPVDYNNKEERYNWELVFTELYAGGKYNAGGEGYDYSLGLNGLGLTATQYASKWMKADVWRDGQHYFLTFEKGENVGGLNSQETRFKRTGTLIHWMPDLDVFTDINVPREYFVDVLKKQAVVNAGVRFVFIDESADEAERETEFYYENGITDYVTEVVDKDAFSAIQSIVGSAVGKDREDRPEYKVLMHASFCFSNKVQMLEYYHNSSFLEHGGSPERAVKTAFVNQIDAFIRQKGLYKKDESRITFTDVQDCLVYISSSFSTVTSYENQTKKAITNRFIAQAMTEFLKQNLEVYFIENPEEATKIAQQILVNKQSREHAEKTRQSLKKTISTQMDIANRVQKFVDCRSKDPAVREIYIVEGDSALGAVKTSRDAEYQAIMPVRGKILNCLKADYNKIFKSEIITDLVKVLGCGVEMGGKNRKDLATFDINSLRWNKVIICTDADVDGFQIRTLILTMIYRLMPTLIKEGYVYIAETPLYEIEAKGKTYFAYSEQEKADVMSKIPKDTKVGLQRSKGLGENDPEMMWLTTMNPETRRLVKVIAEEPQRTEDVFNLLLGDNLAGRKQHIAEHGYEYLDELDVS